MPLMELDYQPSFTPGGSEAFENAAWDTRNYRISCGWDEKDADSAYQAEMSSEGYGREAEVG